ncbi:MAG: bifunctional DNA primase/polymerase [Acidimicrobiia bacterium]
MRPIDAALSYAAQGWAVFPCHTSNGGNCSCHAADCSSPGKHPRVAGGLLAASTDLARVTKWWERSPASNIGVRTGVESGLVVLDIDPRHGGSRSIKALVDAHGDLSTVPRVRTGSGGWHLVFAHPGEPVRNSAGRLGPGLDIRGDGGYVIAPPSVHSCGREYRWEVDPKALPAMPDWLLRAVTRPAAVVRSPMVADGPNNGDGSNWARAALDAEIRLVRSAPAGSRNMTLNRSAFCLGQIVGAGMLEQHVVERLLVESGIGVGLGEREAIMTVRSGLRAGLDHPRRPTSKRPDGARRDRGVDVAL